MKVVAEPDVEQELLHHQFPMLDSMRAIGAIAVFTTHAAFWSGDYIGHGVWGSLLARFDVGVAIFFVLSGFLLSRPYLATASVGRPAPALGRYYWKRALRVLPLYLLTALLALVFIRANRDLGVLEWVQTLSLTNTFVDDQLPNGLTHMWSIAVEVCFYVVLPLLMFLAIGRRRRLAPGRVLALVLAMVAITVWWELWGSPWAGGWTSGQPGQWLPAYLGWFGLGIFLALVDLLHRRGTWGRLTSRVVALAHQPGACWAMIAGLMLMSATPLAGPSMLGAPTPGQLLTKNVIYGLVGGLIVVTGVFSVPGTGYTRLMSHRLFRHLGFISYGIFCLHLPVLHLVMWLTGWELFEGRLLPIWCLALAGTLVAAELAYRFVEAPCMRLKDLGRRSSAATSSAPSTETSAR